MRRLIILFIGYLMQLSADGQNTIAILDSLKIEVSKNIADSTKAKLYGDISWQYNSISIDSAIKYGEKSLQIAKKLNNKKLIAQALNDLGASYFLQLELNKALELYTEAKEIRIELKDSVGIAALDTKLGGLFLKRSEYDKALEHYHKALKFYEGIQNEAYAATVQGQIALVHAQLKNYSKALEYLTKVENYFSQNPNYSFQRANNLIRMGGIYLAMEDTLQSIQKYTEAGILAEATQNTYAISAVNLNLGSIFTVQKEHTKALLCLKKSYEISKMNKLASDFINSCINLGINYNYLRQFTEAKTYLLQAVKELQSNSESELMGKAYINLIPVYAVEKKVDSVFYFLDAYTSIQNNIYNENISMAVAEMETKYDTEKKEQTIVLLDTKNKAQKLKTTLIILAFGLILLLAAVAFYIWQIKQKSKQAKLISEKEIALQKAVMETEEKERKRIAQDLHDGVAQLLVAANMQLSENKTTEKASKMVQDAIEEIRNISHIMMPQALLQFGFFKALENLENRFPNNKNTSINIHTSGDDTILPEEYKNHLYRIIQEIISNALKHAQAKNLNIEVSVFEDETTIIAEDNGIGFDSNLILQKGIGLKNIATRIAYLNGKLHIESNSGKGTTVIIQI